jgi:lysophospholipid acyltransferase (LPLAT)-like uncharacterized protein
VVVDSQALENAAAGRSGSVSLSDYVVPRITMQVSADHRPSLPITSGTVATPSYTFANLSAYSLKERLLIRAASLAFYLLIKLVGWTARFEIEGWEHLEALVREKRVPIHVAWHECIYLGVYFWRQRGIVYMTSRSFDGEYIARFLQRFGFGAVRGSSSRGGARALIEMARLVRMRIQVGFTVDGPRGPRHIAKPGAVLLAKKTRQPILPFQVTASHCLRISSWDRMQIPLPFTRALVSVAPPIHVPHDADEATIAAKRDELQQALDEITQRGVEWRNGAA